MVKTKRSKNNLDKYLRLTWRKIWILVVGGFVSILLHNLFYAIFGFEEAVFFIITVILIPIYFVISAGYTFYRSLR